MKIMEDFPMEASKEFLKGIPVGISNGISEEFSEEIIVVILAGYTGKIHDGTPEGIVGRFHKREVL